MISMFLVSLKHHFTCLIQPSSLATITVVLILACQLHFATRNKLYRQQRAIDIPGCYRIDDSAVAYPLDTDGCNDNTRRKGQARVAALSIYPVKSCQGIQLRCSKVTATGLKYDRLFSFARRVKSSSSSLPEATIDSVGDAEGNAAWEVITQRECPQLARIQTEIWLPLADPSTFVHADEGVRQTWTNSKVSEAGDRWRMNGGCLVMRFPRASQTKTRRSDLFWWWFSHAEPPATDTIKIPLAPELRHQRSASYTRERLNIWLDRPHALNVASDLDARTQVQLTAFLGLDNPVSLFRVDENDLRTVTRSLPQEQARLGKREFTVGFADAFPIHLLGVPSILAVEGELPSTAAMRRSLEPQRFRANIYIDGTSAYEEDCWMKIRAGFADDGSESERHDAEYHVACRTARCIMTNVHPKTGQRDRSEPHATLKKTRQVDEGAKPHPCLGLSVMPLFNEGVITVGDLISVDRTGEHVYEKMFK